MNRKPDNELTPEELKRRQTLRKRLFYVYLVLIVVLVGYLLFEIFTLIKK